MEAIYGTGIDTREQNRAFRERHGEHWGPASTTQTTVGLPGPKLRNCPYASRKSSAVWSGSGKSSQAVQEI